MKAGSSYYCVQTRKHFGLYLVWVVMGHTQYPCPFCEIHKDFTYLPRNQRVLSRMRTFSEVMKNVDMSCAVNRKSVKV